MPDLDLLVPSSLVDAALADELLRDQAMPNLTHLLARADAPVVRRLMPHGSLTPWQDWVFAHRANVDAARVNLGELWAMACGRPPAVRGGRYVVEPAHFKVANDHLRLDDPHALGISLVEARALAAVIEPVLAEAGWRLDALEPATLTHWMVQRDEAVLTAAAIERAIGDNVAAWQPRARDDAPPAAGDRDGPDAALAWRRCINEIQMLWFGHAVNEMRDANGRPTVNTLWLSGNGAPMTALPHYVAVDSGLPLLAALSVEPEAATALESFDRFIEPMRRDDWSGWREQLERLDLRLGGVLRQQVDGSLGAVTLVFCGRDSSKAVRLGPRGISRDLPRWWRGLWPRGRKPSLATLFTEESVP